jgi:hypothetical protein
MLRLLNATMAIAPSGRKIIRGYLGPDSLEIPTDDYQRGQVQPILLSTYRDALASGEVEEICVGSRGTRTRINGEQLLILGDDTFLVDGRRRVNAAQKVRDEEGDVFLPVVVYLGTTYEWERQRFKTLNADRIKVSPNVLIRNARGVNKGIGALYKYSEGDNRAPLYRRVRWTQSGRKTDLMTALLLLRVVNALHTPFGGVLGTAADDLETGLEKLVDYTSVNTFLANVNTFFELINSSWGLRDVNSTKNAYFLRASFLLSLCRVLTRHANFWNGNLLVIPDELRSKFGEIKLDAVQREQIGSVGRAMKGLQELMETKLSTRPGPRLRLRPV